MKLRGQQTKSRQYQKIYSQVYGLLSNKSDLRSKGHRTMEKHLDNVTRIANGIYEGRYNDAYSFNLRIYKSVMNTGLENGLSKSSLESLHSTMRKLQSAVGKDFIAANANKAMGKEGFYRKGADRYNPQQQDTGLRLKQQEELTKISTWVGMAAANSLHSGVRKNESFSSCEIVRKTMQGKIETTNGAKAGEFRQIDMRTFRNNFTHGVKDSAFEKNYLNKMRPGVEYVYVADTFAKGGRPRLVPVLNIAQREQAIKSQQMIRENRAAARAAGYDNWNKIKTVIPYNIELAKGYKMMGDALEKVGMTKSAANFTMHSDRVEFNTRMKLSDLDLSKQERALALGHGRTEVLRSYGD